MVKAALHSDAGSPFHVRIGSVKPLKTLNFATQLKKLDI